MDDVFVQLTTKNTSSTSASVNVARTQQVYIKVVSSGVSSVNVYINDTSKTYNIKHNHIIDLGVLNSTDDVQVTLSDSSDGNLSIIAYTINQTAFIDAINRLSQNGLEITKMSDTHIEGTITADYDGKMLLSIPYDLGWKIRIDGEVVKQDSVIEALTILDVSKGTHTISMDYSPEGFKSGIAITIICVIILFVLMLSRHYPALVQKNKKDNIINDNAGDALNI